MSKKITQGQGVCHGCNLSPTLFNVYIDELAVLLEQSTAPVLNLNNREVKLLLYADDLVLSSPTEHRASGSARAILSELGPDSTL